MLVLAPASASAARRVNPCALVTARQVAAVTHSRVSGHVLAPLGPTCIFRLEKTGKQLTITVGGARFSALVRQIPRRKRHRVSVRGRRGYCGVLGGPILYVSLRHRKVLTITAACTPARRLAAIALRRI